MFFATLLVINIWILEVIPAIFAEKAIFYRELRSGALSSSFAAWITMGVSVALAAIVISMLYAIPAYYLSGLQSSAIYFMQFYFAILFATLCNVYIAYFVAYITPNIWVNVIIYPGILVPASVSNIVKI